MSRQIKRGLVAKALSLAILMASCVPRVSGPSASNEVRSASAGSSETALSPAATPSKEPETRSVERANLQLLSEPDRMWIRDQQGGLGTSYSLDAQVLHFGDRYEADCTLEVDPYSGGPLDIPARFERQTLPVPRAKVVALVDALKKARLVSEKNGLIELSPIDDNSEGELLMFAKRGGAPLYLHLGPVSSMTVDSNGHYRIQDAKEARAAYRAMVDSMGLQDWVRASTNAAVQAALAKPPHP